MLDIDVQRHRIQKKVFHRNISKLQFVILIKDETTIVQVPIHINRVNIFTGRYDL